jgi:putative DNA primase/helicase
MPNSIDVPALRSAALAPDIIGRYVALTKHGHEHKGLCPFHTEKTPSFTVYGDKFHCFGCGAHGDVIDFVRKVESLDFRAAADRVAGMVGTFAAPDAPAAERMKPTWTPILPVPDDAPSPPPSHHVHGTPDATWTYHDGAGRLLGYVRRFNRPDGGKEVVPLCYCSDGAGNSSWRSISFPKPRPIFGLERLAANTDANVVICEGEKATIAGRKLFPQAIVITWPGGAKAFHYVEWSPLAGRKIVLWPDADAAGMAAALGIADILRDIAAGVRIALPPPGKGDGWDAADMLAEGGTPDSAMTWLRSALRTPDQLRAELAQAEEAPAPQPELDELDGVGPAEYSDDAIAAEFSARHADGLRYVPQRGWLRWDGQRWRHVADVLVMEMARVVCREIAARARQDDALTPGMKDRLPRQIASAKTVAAVEKMGRGAHEHHCGVEQWDANPWLLTTPGGTVDLRNGELRPHRREDLITKLAGATPRGDCPTWERFIDRVTGGDPGLKDYLQRTTGYALVGDASEECLIYVYGPGGNGKGTFLGTVTAILGEYAATASADTFMQATGDRHPTDLARLDGARCVVSQEVDEGKHWDEARIKSLTGRDVITARYMRRDFFEFRPVFTLIIAGNHRPGLKTVDEAIRRRFHLVPFDVTIPPEERDPGLKDALLAERDGIMAWAVAGCLAWQRQRLSPPESVLAATGDYLREEDTFGQWLTECCVVGADHEERSGNLYDSFRAWKAGRGEGVLSQKKFSAALRDRGFRLERSAVARKIVGLRLNDFEYSRLTDARLDEAHGQRSANRSGRWSDA